MLPLSGDLTVILFVLRASIANFTYLCPASVWCVMEMGRSSTTDSMLEASGVRMSNWIPYDIWDWVELSVGRVPLNTYRGLRTSINLWSLWGVPPRVGSIPLPVITCPSGNSTATEWYCLGYCQYNSKFQVFATVSNKTRIKDIQKEDNIKWNADDQILSWYPDKDMQQNQIVITPFDKKEPYTSIMPEKSRLFFNMNKDKFKNFKIEQHCVLKLAEWKILWTKW